VDNQAQFDAGMQAFIKQLEEAAVATVKDLAEKAVNTARSTTAFHNTLKEKTHFTQNGLSAIVMDDRSYAFYLEEGNNQNGPRIYPRTAKALHFFINGSEVFAKSVRSHGPYHYVSNGRNVAENVIEQTFAKYFQGVK
jgi:hypothetical protein